MREQRMSYKLEHEHHGGSADMRVAETCDKFFKVKYVGTLVFLNERAFLIAAHLFCPLGLT